MTGASWLLIGLLKSGWALGAGAGVGSVGDRLTLEFTPWISMQHDALAVGLHAPLRLDLELGELRERDWDEAADFGRLLRFLRYDEHLRVGGLADLSLGYGTIVRRYHNGVDDDHYRLGAHAQYASDGWAFNAFTDQLLGTPVAAARLAFDLNPIWTLGATLGADFAAPISIDGTLDKTGGLRGETQVLAAYGVDAGWHVLRSRARSLTLYGTLDGLEVADLGAHLGARGEYRDGPWQYRLQLEGGYSAAGFEPGWFDEGYLIDRWRGKAVWREEFEAAATGRIVAELEYQKALRIGMEYSDASEGGRSGLAAWVRVPTKSLDVATYYRVRYPTQRAGVLDPTEAIAATAWSLHLDDWWWARLTLARMWRTAGLDGAARVRPFTEASLTIAVRIGG